MPLVHALLFREHIFDNPLTLSNGCAIISILQVRIQTNRVDRFCLAFLVWQVNRDEKYGTKSLTFLSVPHPSRLLALSRPVWRFVGFSARGRVSTRLWNTRAHGQIWAWFGSRNICPTHIRKCFESDRWAASKILHRGVIFSHQITIPIELYTA